MLLVITRGKYEIELIKSIDEDLYVITVYFDNKAVKVSSLKLLHGEYKLEIKKETIYDDYTEITIRKLYGKKFKKNFETMKKLIDKFFNEGINKVIQ